MEIIVLIHCKGILGIIVLIHDKGIIVLIHHKGIIVLIHHKGILGSIVIYLKGFGSELSLENFDGDLSTD